MTIIIFIIVLALLIFVHELGHFLAAKATGMRVDEFGIGFPPKVFSWKRGETTYSLNWIPFGGFVKIHGEDYDAVEGGEGVELERSFTSKPKWAQAIVLVAGVFFNLLLAWLLISTGLMSGLPISASNPNLALENPQLTITSVIPDSPAQEAGLKAGDVIITLSSGDSQIIDIDGADEAADFIAGQENLELSVLRAGEEFELELETQEGIVDGKRAIGVTFDVIGTAQLGFFMAFFEGLKMTVFLTGAIAVALWNFIASAFAGSADLSQVAGPVGIVSLVGDASRLGLVYLSSFTAIISLHLAIINLVPFPALDGGRLLFVLIEKIKGSPIKPKIANWLNTIGFAILILLMIVITVSDVVKLF